MSIERSIALATDLAVGDTIVEIGTAALLQPGGASFDDAADDVGQRRDLTDMLAAAATLGGLGRGVLADDRPFTTMRTAPAEPLRPA